MNRVPRHDLDLEDALVGAIVLHSELLVVAQQEGLVAEDFRSPAHRRAFEAVASLVSGDEAVDAVIVAERVRALGHGTPTKSDLVGSVANAPVPSHVSDYARRVHDLGRLRRLAGLSAELSELGTTPTVEVAEALDKAGRLIGAWLTEGSVGAEPLMASEIVDRLLDELSAEADGTAPRPLSTGLVDLDRLLRGGLWPSQHVLVGARPSQGKTSLALGMARAAARAGARVLVCSVEMSSREIAERLLAMGGVPTDRQAAGLTAIERERAEQERSRLVGLQLYVDDDPGATVLSIRSRARQMARGGGLDLVVVDYLQLISHRETENRQNQVAEISRQLKRLARELAVPVATTAQLSRALETRADKRPVLADLRESGQLEQDADIVCLLHRPIAYDPGADPGAAEVIVAKHRSGPTGTVPVAWLPQRTSFVNAVSEDRLR